MAEWRIRQVNLKTGIITTFAGTGKPKAKPDRASIGDDGPAAKAIIVGARAVCVDGQGNTYICEREGNAIRKVDGKGIITTIAGTGKQGHTGDGGNAREATFNGPKGVTATAEGLVYVVDSENQAIRLIDTGADRIFTVAGGGPQARGFAGEKVLATEAKLDRPHGICLAPSGGLYLGDTNNHRVRWLHP